MLMRKKHAFQYFLHPLLDLFVYMCIRSVEINQESAGQCASGKWQSMRVTSETQDVSGRGWGCKESSGCSRGLVIEVITVAGFRR